MAEHMPHHVIPFMGLASRSMPTATERDMIPQGHLPGSLAHGTRALFPRAGRFRRQVARDHQWIPEFGGLRRPYKPNFAGWGAHSPEHRRADTAFHRQEEPGHLPDRASLAEHFWGTAVGSRLLTKVTDEIALLLHPHPVKIRDLPRLRDHPPVARAPPLGRRPLSTYGPRTSWPSPAPPPPYPQLLIQVGPLAMTDVSSFSEPPSVQSTCACASCRRSCTEPTTLMSLGHPRGVPRGCPDCAQLRYHARAILPPQCRADTGRPAACLESILHVPVDHEHLAAGPGLHTDGWPSRDPRPPLPNGLRRLLPRDGITSLTSWPPPSLPDLHSPRLLARRRTHSQQQFLSSLCDAHTLDFLKARQSRAHRLLGSPASPNFDWDSDLRCQF